MTNPYKSFAEYLYQTRNNWIKHIIPVSYFDISLGVYLEAYITTPVKAVAENDVDEDDGKVETTVEDLIIENKPITIRLAHISQYVNSVLIVDPSMLYPSARKLTTVSEKYRKAVGAIETVSIYPDYIDQFRPTEKLDINNLEGVFKALRGIDWTAGELAAMLNRPQEDLTKFIEVKLKSTGKRRCKITNMDSPVYKLEDVPNPDKLKKQLSTTHQIVDTVDELYSNYKSCTACELGVKRKARKCNVVPSRGNKTNPKFFIIGEAPGGQEEETGIPFNPDAPAGNILAKVMELAGFDQNDVYITNSVICRPEQEDGKPGLNGKPKNGQIVACNARLKNELAILKPQIVIILGKSAYRSFFGNDPDGVTRSVGWVDSPHHKVYFVPHPSYIIRQISMTKGEDKERVKKEYLEHFTIIKNAI